MKSEKLNVFKMFYCVPCAIEFEEDEHYKLHILNVHSPKKKSPKKKKSSHGKIALKQYVNLPDLFCVHEKTLSEV